MTPSQLDVLYRPLAEKLHAGHMKELGIEPTMRLALAYNRAKYGQQESWRNLLYRNRFTELLDENGGLTRTPLELHDGWALDTSCSLPHLDRVLDDAEKIIHERRGHRITQKGAYRSYFQDVWTPEDLTTYPSFVDFATSSDLLAVVGNYLKSIPALTTTLPSGIRFVESNDAFDDDPSRPKDSQLYHIDYYSLPNVYVLVLLRDATLTSGPWTFIPREQSQQASRALNYWQKGHDYRLTDHEVYSVIDPSEVITFAYPRGSVLFIESSGCLHYGSRNSIEPRFQLMYGFSGVIRTDFSEVFLKRKGYPIRESDSLLRKLVLNKYMPAPEMVPAVDESQIPFLLETLRSLSDQLGLPMNSPDASLTH